MTGYQWPFVNKGNICESSILHSFVKFVFGDQGPNFEK